MTDTITLKRETVQQVLDALEIYGAAAPDVYDTITALRAALQQAEPQAQAGEPEVVAWMSPGKERLEFSRKDTVYGSHTLPLITPQSHREAMAELQAGYRMWFGIAKDQGEAIANKDAALKACVEALKSHVANKQQEDAITQAQEQLK